MTKTYLEKYIEVVASLSEFSVKNT